MSTKTYDSQTAKFIACVAQAMPTLSGEMMQKLIDSPRTLKDRLKIAFGEHIELNMFDVSKLYKDSSLIIEQDFERMIYKEGFVVNRKATELQPPKRLPRDDMSDTQICKELLGGIEMAKKNAVSLSQIWDLIHSKESIKLMKRNRVNMFFAMGKRDALVPVYLCWGPGARMWILSANSFDEDNKYRDGGQVFTN